MNYLGQSFSRLSPDWQLYLDSCCQQQLTSIDQKLQQLAQTSTIYPEPVQIFRALEAGSPQTIKVVIVGQDPYHGENEANGLAFAVNPGVRQPPSLRNIYKELILEYNLPLSKFSNNLLDNWVSQGVLLLNCTLTVIKDQPNSLATIGWHSVTDNIIHQISQVNPGCVFMLWGNFARSKKKIINSSKHLILEAAHPSPFSAQRGFFGCDHFKLANQFLLEHNLTPIDWLV